jgi:hypothetical protein
MKNMILFVLCTVMFVFGIVGVAGAITYEDLYVTEIFLCVITLFVTL